MKKSNKMKEIDINTLVDIRDISINPALPKEERIKEYVRQIKDPYCFRCGKYIVVSKFNENGLTLEECFKSMM